MLREDYLHLRPSAFGRQLEWEERKFERDMVIADTFRPTLSAWDERDRKNGRVRGVRPAHVHFFGILKGAVSSYLMFIERILITENDGGIKSKMNV